MSESPLHVGEEVFSEAKTDRGQTYSSLVSLLRAKNPNLSDLEQILTSRDGSSEHGRAAVIEISDGNVAVCRFKSSNELLDHMSLHVPRSSCSRRLFLLEGLPANYIEILGSHLQVDPNVFARQIKSGQTEILQGATEAPLLSSHPTSKTSFAMRFHELQDFGDGIQSFDLLCANQPRRISVTRLNGKFDGVGIVRRKTSFWYRKHGERGWDGTSDYFKLKSIHVTTFTISHSLDTIGPSSRQEILRRPWSTQEVLLYSEYSFSRGICRFSTSSSGYSGY